MMPAVKAQKVDKATVKKDIVSITDVLNNYYLKDLFRRYNHSEASFDPRTLVYGDIKGVPYFKTVQQYVDGVGHRQSPKDSGKTF